MSLICDKFPLSQEHFSGINWKWGINRKWGFNGKWGINGRWGINGKWGIKIFGYFSVERPQVRRPDTSLAVRAICACCCECFSVRASSVSNALVYAPKAVEVESTAFPERRVAWGHSSHNFWRALFEYWTDTWVVWWFALPRGFHTWFSTLFGSETCLLKLVSPRIQASPRIQTSPQTLSTTFTHWVGPPS